MKSLLKIVMKQVLFKLKKLIKEGYKTKEAIKIVALLFNANKNKLYELYLAKKQIENNIIVMLFFII